MDFYELLGVSREAAAEDIRRAFRRQVREYHPDLNDDPRAPAQFMTLKTAYEVLADPKEREAYDRLGHEEYVAERTSGIPSTKAWDTAAGGGTRSTDTDDADRATAGRRGRDRDTTTTHDRTASTAAEGDDVSEDVPWSDAEDVEEEFDIDFDLDEDLGFDDEVADADRTADVTVDLDASAAPGGFVEESGAVLDDDPNVQKSPTASGAGTARGPKTAPDPGGPTPSRPSATERYTDETPGADGPTVRERLHSVTGWLVGWPLVLVADGLYAVTLAMYYLANEAGFERLIDAVATRGLSPAVFESRYGIEGLAAMLGATNAGGVTPMGAVALLGVAALPSVYLFLVRWTRRYRKGWQPSYLYVVGAVTPTAGLVVSGAVAASSLAFDLLVYVVVPIATMVLMLTVGQLLPVARRALRRYRYRLTN